MASSDQALLEQYCNIIPIVQRLTASDIGVSICDREKCLCYHPGKTLKFPAKPGTPILAGSAAHRALTENRRIVIRVPKEQFGIPYIAIATPIHNENGQVIGVVSVQESVERQDTLQEMASVINVQVKELSVAAESISARIQELAAVGASVVSSVAASAAAAQDTSSVVDFIKQIASQTNLLGLNAAIEAARVGDQGRGFGVVAAEIRKLAATSADSIGKIDQVLKSIQSGSEKTKHEVAQIEFLTTEVAASIVQVAAAVDSIAGQIATLDKLAQNLNTEA